VEGSYFSETDAEGNSTLNVSGYLVAPITLSNRHNHYFTWVMGNDDYAEWFWTGWEGKRFDGGQPVSEVQF
jgi:hypothetical protein